MNDVMRDEDSIFPEADIRYSTFWDRFGASLLDGFLMLGATMPLTYFNITNWKIPSLYILIGLFSVLYKPFLEYRYGATWGKMIVGLRVVGHGFGKITLREELRRVSFYLVPSLLQHGLTTVSYYSAAFRSSNNYQEFNSYIINANPSILWLNGIVFVLLIVDTITFFSTSPNRALHDIYAGTYVIQRRR
jgi:uncharacterized RDD family membrane protein YckC